MRHGSIKRVVSAVRRDSVAFELTSIPGPILNTIAQMTDSEAVMNLLRKVPLFANLKDEDKVCIEEAKNGSFPVVKCSFRKGKHAEHFFCSSRGRDRRLEKTG